MVENSQACWVRRMETPLWTACDGSWYSRTHLSGHGAQHCGQRTLPCAISGMEQKKAWGSRPGFQDMGQSPTVRVTSEGRLARLRQKGINIGHPFPTPSPLAVTGGSRH